MSWFIQTVIMSSFPLLHKETSLNSTLWLQAKAAVQKNGGVVHISWIERSVSTRWSSVTKNGFPTFRLWMKRWTISYPLDLFECVFIDAIRGASQRFFLYTSANRRKMTHGPFSIDVQSILYCVYINYITDL